MFDTYHIVKNSSNSVCIWLPTELEGHSACRDGYFISSIEARTGFRIWFIRRYV